MNPQDMQSESEYVEIEEYLNIYQRTKLSDGKEAFRAIKSAARASDRLFSSQPDLNIRRIDLWQRAKGNLALAYLDRKRYLDADKQWNEALSIHDSIIDHELRQELLMSRSRLDSALDQLKFSKTKQWLRDLEPGVTIGEGISNSTRSMKADMETKLFRAYAKKGRVNSAIKHYSNAIDLLSGLENEEALKSLESEYDLWQSSLNEHAVLKEESTTPKISLDSSQNRLESLRAEVERIENSGLTEEQTELFARYKALQTAIAEEEKRSALAIQERENQIEDQEREILLLEQENELASLSLEQQRLLKEEESLKKKSLGIGLVLLTALLISVFILYRNKYRSNERLQHARDELAIANEKVASLLQQQLSGDIADTLIEGTTSDVQERYVAVMFTDIRDFTPKVADLPPEDIIRYQNDVFGFMIDIVEKFHGNINQLMGDGFMATFGAPKSFGNDIQNAVDAGMEILKTLNEFNLAGSIQKTEIGIGIDCGYAVMGNVGNDSRKQFSITGNVVISAARIEQTNKELATHFLISDEVKQKVNIPCQTCEHMVSLKGRDGRRKVHEINLPS